MREKINCIWMGRKFNLGWMNEQIMFFLLKKYSSQLSDTCALDIGCATGEISQELIKNGYKVEGINFSDVAIDIFKDAGLDCYLSDIDEGIKEKNNSFDLVWVGDIIEHV